MLPADDPNQIALASLDQAPSANDLISSVESVDGTASYSYDPSGQLTGASYSSNLQSQIPNPSSESYSYDASGNRINSGYIIGPDNEILSDGTYTYQYDADGNQIERTDIATGAETLYTWDNRNRLVSVTDENVRRPDHPDGHLPVRRRQPLDRRDRDKWWHYDADPVRV